MIKWPDDMHNTITLDQEAAESVGRQTRVPYLLLGPMHDGLSSNRKGVSLPGNTSRPAVFTRLFINGSPDEVAREVRRVQDGQSILDGTRDQLKALERMTAPGTRIGEHDASHHGKEPSKIEQVAAFEEAHFKLLDHLLKKLSDSAEGGGTLLDNTQVLFLSNMGDGSAHASNNLPVLLAGGGNKHPGHIAFDRQKNHPLSNLYVRVLQQMGLPCERFGSSTAALSELG